MADLLTPVSAFLKIAEHSDYAFLLESVEGGEQVARYSFLGKDPFLILRAAGRPHGDRARRRERRRRSEPLPRRRCAPLMAEFRSPHVPGLPRFTGGAVGYLGYDAVPWFEPVPLPPPRRRRTPPADEAGFMVFDTVLAFDHVQHRILLIANARVTRRRRPAALYQFACAKIEFLEARTRTQPVAGARRRQAAPLRGAVEPDAGSSSSARARRRRTRSRPATSTRSCCRSVSRPTCRPIRSRCTGPCAT